MTKKRVSKKEIQNVYDIELANGVSVYVEAPSVVHAVDVYLSQTKREEEIFSVSLYARGPVLKGK